MDDRPMQGQVALITGGVRRIGRATALALAAEDVARDVAVLGRRALADVNDEAAVEAMMRRSIRPSVSSTSW